MAFYANYLIHACFKTTSNVSGALLIDGAMTEEEAREKVKMYSQRSREFFQAFPHPSYHDALLEKDVVRWHTYNPNPIVRWKAEEATIAKMHRDAGESW
jgi:hypothetical protein